MGDNREQPRRSTRLLKLVQTCTYPTNSSNQELNDVNEATEQPPLATLSQNNNNQSNTNKQDETRPILLSQSTHTKSSDRAQSSTGDAVIGPKYESVNQSTSRLQPDRANAPVSHSVTSNPDSKVCQLVRIASQSHGTQTNKPKQTKKQPDLVNSSNRPVSSQAGIKPAPVNSSNRPVSSQAGIQPPPVNSSNRPVSSQAGIQPVPVSYASRPVPSQVGIQSVPVNYAYQPVPSQAVIQPYPQIWFGPIQAGNQPVPLNSINWPDQPRPGNQPVPVNSINRPDQPRPGNQPVPVNSINRPDQPRPGNQPVPVNSINRPDQPRPGNQPVPVNSINRPDQPRLGNQPVPENSVRLPGPSLQNQLMQNPIDFLGDFYRYEGGVLIRSPLTENERRNANADYMMQYSDTLGFRRPFPVLVEEATSSSESWSRSQAVAFKINHTWTIDNFSQYLVDNVVNDQNNQRRLPRLVSPVFSSPENESIKFTLAIFPSGENESSRDYMAMYLHYLSETSAPDSVGVALTVFDVDTDPNKFCEFSLSNFRQGKSWGWPKLSLRSRINSPNNKLSIRLELKVMTGMVHSSSFDISKQATSISPDKLRGTLSKDFEVLLDSGKHSDMTLSFAGSCYPVHRAVLAAQSPVFAAMFEHDTEECRMNHVDIKDIAADAMPVLLKYIYNGVTPDKEVITTDLLIAADKYQIDSLKSICEESLSEILEVETVCTLLLLADMYNARTLKNNCIMYITDHSTEVTMTESWKNMGMTRPELTIQLFRDLALRNGNSAKRQRIS